MEPTKNHFFKARESLDAIPPKALVFIQPGSFYRGKTCREIFGENPSDAELQKAENNENGYIKSLCGLRLHISRFLATAKG